IFSPRGVGLVEGLRILEKVKAELDLPVVTDVHETTQCPAVGQVVDLIQIPAFLARQTDLLVAAAKTGKAVNVKKGQFMAPDDMRNVAAKLTEAGNENILFCERGTSFGYHTLIVDFTGLIEMRKIGFPIVFDATHSVQKPGGNGTSSGGNREYAAPLMNAALAVGVDAIFAEVHPDPSRAISDAENQIPLAEIREILCRAQKIDRVSRAF
ncbi:MAG: 3-deoxy-8-phosphooctulonate synthase, partial [Thermoguttaceae bacterium]|nr:3-deoxy-8-phosphooctulonate synthase [Thermoguttaceae bacterium]